MKKIKTVFNVNTITTHCSPHLDEVVAIVLLQEYGRKIFPSIEKAKYAFIDAGSQSLNGKLWLDHLKEGNLLVGVGGGAFDEHPTEVVDRAKDHCAATLVAEYLGIENNSELQQLLKYTKNNDLNGGTNPFDFASLITLGNRTYWDTDPQAIFEWALQPIKWYLAKQKKFFIETKAEFDKYAVVQTIPYKNRDINIVSVQSDNVDMGAYARSEHGAYAALVIQQNSKKQIIITTQKRAKINLDRVIVEIRKNEARFKGVNYQNLELNSDGTISQIPEWYYDKPAARILNGALSAPHVPATKIEMSKIVDIVCSLLQNS